MEAGNVPGQIVKAVACHAARTVQVQSVQPLHYLGVIRYLKIRNLRLAEALQLDIAGVILADGYSLVNYIGDHQHDGADAFFQLLFLFFQFGQAGASGGDLLLYGVGLLALALSHERAYLLGETVAVCPKIVRLAYGGAVLPVQLNDLVHQVADWGYKYIEQSPHPRIKPFYKHPLFSKECEEEYRKALKETGVEISSFICVYRWSGPTEEQRKMAVANWKRIIQIAVDMGVPVINTELSGDPNQAEICNGMWFRSMEELLPIIEREGLRVEIQSHP